MKVLNLLFFIINTYFLSFCSNSKSNDHDLISIKTNESLTNVNKKHNNFSNIDSVSLTYYKGEEANSYYFKLKNQNLTITDEFFNYKKVINSEDTLVRFLGYITKFYVDKTQKIILKKKKNNFYSASDYSSINVIVYKDKKQLIEEYIQLGDEKFDLTFNQSYLEFYSLIKSMTPERRR